MKRRSLLRYLEDHNCAFLREGRGHTIYYNIMNGLQTAVPRHREIQPILIRKICKDLALPMPREK